MSDNSYPFPIMNWHQLTRSQKEAMCTRGLRGEEQESARAAFRRYCNGGNLSLEDEKYIVRGQEIYYKPGQEGGIPHKAKINPSALDEFLGKHDFSHVTAHADGGSGDASNIRMEDSKYNRDRGFDYHRRSKAEGRRVPEEWKEHQQEAAKRKAYAEAEDIYRRHRQGLNQPEPSENRPSETFFDQVGKFLQSIFGASSTSSSSSTHRYSSHYRDDKGTTWYNVSDPGDSKQYWTDAPPETWSEPEYYDEAPNDLYYDQRTARDCADSSHTYIGTDSEGNNYFE